MVEMDSLSDCGEHLPSDVEVDAFRRLFPLQYYERHLSQSIRPDGRSLFGSREASVALGAVATAPGSAMAKIGSTTMLAAVILEVMTPSEESPDEGCIAIDFHMPPICSESVRPGRPSEIDAILSKQLSDAIVRSGMINLKELSLVTGKAAWIAYLDIYCLDADGSLFDAALLAGVAAISHLRIPEVCMNEKGRVVMWEGEKGGRGGGGLKAINKEKRRLRLKSIPLSLTCLLHKKYILADPTAEEESVFETPLTVVLTTEGHLVSLLKLGGPVLATTSIIQRCVELAKGRSKEVEMILRDAAATSMEE